MNSKSSIMPAAYAVALATIPGVLALTPTARWGHQAVYVKSKQSMYIVGGEVPTSGSQITNDVLVLSLNSSSASFSTASSDGLPPHAFASMVLNPSGSSLVVTGGITSSCSSDATTHTLNLDNNDGWVSTTPNKFLRRRGAGAAYVTDSSGNSDILVIGGIADKYVCSSSTNSYPASDVLSLPLSSSSLISSRSLPTSLTGSSLAVSDFALTTGTDGKIYLTGGQTSSGEFVDMTTVGVWDSSNGWNSQVTSGDIPSGRVGASLVAHPNLDILVLHGGSTDSSSGTSSNLLSFLNTTTWTWSTPSNLQPPTSSATSYHTSVMTDQGVMITAFGLSSKGSPRSDIYYLDLRDPTGSNWSWKNQWNSNMLEPYTSTSTGSTGNNVTTAKDKSTNDNNGGSSSKKIASITVPVIIIALILSPLIVYLIRRRMRLIKKRRMARHFSFSSQEDEGAFGFGNATKGIFSRITNKKRTQANNQYPFINGKDGNEVQGNFFTNRLSRMVSRISNNSFGSNDENEDAIPYVPPREMVAVTNSRSVTFGNNSNNGNYTDKENNSNNRQMNWEEIDFGLGKLDESKQQTGSPFNDDVNHTLSVNNNSVSPFGDHAVIATSTFDFPIAAPQTTNNNGLENQGYTSEMLYSDNGILPPSVGRLGSSNIATHQEPLIPSLFVQPATVPSTPNGNNGNLSVNYPAMIPSTSSAIGGSKPNDNNKIDQSWDNLAKELETKPAFRSISPTAQLKSHSHSHAHGQGQSSRGSVNVGEIYGGIVRSESPRPISPVPSIPPLDFQNQSQSQYPRRPTSSMSYQSNRSSSSISEVGTIRLVHSPSQRRPEFLPFQPLKQGQQQQQHQQQGMRSISQPVNRQLINSVITPMQRRGSSNSDQSPLSSGQTTPTPRNISLSYTQGMRRSSGPSNIANTDMAGNNGSPIDFERRSSMLRVVNLTNEESQNSDKAI
ncbi:uncharacterized protein L201_007687 [Kwoniella dendrophila CBS 6074]|uniref:Galactose oxidase n=1 Tax=Kwoniella dendrophila CBS 6074 TaxID=1295534 RepID=A0AAX4K7H4_9TREE